jgi:L-fucose mutarotase
MLKSNLLHPEILAAIASSGHGGKILITDGNYPHNTRPNPRAKIVWANFTPGVVNAVTILRMLAGSLPIEKAEVMAPAKTGDYAMAHDPPIWNDFRKVLRDYSDFSGELIELDKPTFNQEAKHEDVCLVIATAEKQIYANIMITIGVVR